MELLIALVISMTINLVMFVPAYLFKTDKLTDISYAVTFAVLAWFTAWQYGYSLANIFISILITVWAMRLGGYLLFRVNRLGRDDRFDRMREDFLKFLGFWILQGLTVWIVMIPSVIFLSNGYQHLAPLSYLGILIWLAGLMIEASADWQLFSFITNSANKGKWIDQGLWHYSRHPNYFGEILVWSGLYLFAFEGLIGNEKIIGLIGPAYIAFTIIFISGIRILEKKANARWGNNPAYREYKRKTSILFPLPPKN